jgi:hypothetical protein
MTFIRQRMAHRKPVLGGMPIGFSDFDLFSKSNLFMHSPLWNGGPKSKVSNRLFLIFSLCIEDFVFLSKKYKKLHQ